MNEGVESVTMDAGSDAAAETTSSEQGTQGAPPTPTETQTARTYSEEQLQGVLRGRLEQQKRSYEKRLAEFQKKQAEYDQVVQRMNAGIEQMGRGFGFIKEEQPAYVTEAHLRSLEQQFDQRLNERLVKMQEEQLYSTIQNHWQAVSAKYGEWADMPGFKDAWAKGWGPDKDPMTLAAGIVSAYEKRLAARSNQAAASKDAKVKSAPVKGGIATASSQKEEESVPLRKSLLAAIRASRE